ncbi:hypothetical protein EZH22_08180 [Xanthobacter dioxanivorans]|uniref:DUF883 domain-containing protein n=1 Tax=Xanthobacter dioxanivorans TaxID=2528964 RepID=A0A974PS33_9HYPH|nr:hypothetical protein [Xanthobacter dioxanivorans]QRG08268.1 hypothetical protein EZH22_08180 [Xanthobacter dioxanivorans]
MADKPATIKSVSADAEPSLADVREDLDQLRTDFARLLETLGKTARHGVEGAAGEAGSAAADVTDWAEGQYLTLRESIREQPITACAVAAAVGVILGQFLLRR